MRTLLLQTLFVTFSFSCLQAARAAELNVNDAAPAFSTKDHQGRDFSLESRKGKWTVLYFYPKAGTPGCTKQACAFRDNIDKIRAHGAEVFGISTDSVDAQAKFHQEHKLNFTLLADPDGKIMKMYGTKMPMLKMSKRWTFIISPELAIKAVEKDVDPVMDAQKMADTIAALKQK